MVFIGALDFDFYCYYYIYTKWYIVVVRLAESALPVAVIVGLVLYINNKKNKETKAAVINQTDGTEDDSFSDEKTSK